MARRPAGRPLPKPPTRQKEPVVLRRFGKTGSVVPISRRVNDIAKREGLRVYEDNTYGSDRTPTRRTTPGKGASGSSGQPSLRRLNRANQQAGARRADAAAGPGRGAAGSAGQPSLRRLRRAHQQSSDSQRDVIESRKIAGVSRNRRMPFPPDERARFAKEARPKRKYPKADPADDRPDQFVGFGGTTFQNARDARASFPARARRKRTPQ